jgi:hypothetical protein
VDEHRLRQAFDEVFDQAVVFHGFADYMRDYDVYVYATADPRTGGAPAHLRYRFTQCVRSAVTTSFSCRSSWTSMPPSNGWHALATATRRDESRSPHRAVRSLSLQCATPMGCWCCSRQVRSPGQRSERVRNRICSLNQSKPPTRSRHREQRMAAAAGAYDPVADTTVGSHLTTPTYL